MVNISIPGGASNALVDSSTMYVVGQEAETVSGQTLFGGNLTVVNLTSNTAGTPVAISDGQPGATSRMILADDRHPVDWHERLHHRRSLRQQPLRRLRGKARHSSEVLHAIDPELYRETAIELATIEKANQAGATP